MKTQLLFSSRKPITAGIKAMLSAVTLLVPAMMGSVCHADDSKGLQVRSFTVLPSLEFGAEYIDNLYRQQNNSKGVYLERISPRLSIESGWSRHALGLNVSSDIIFFNGYQNENYQNFATDLHGRIDIQRDSYITMRGGANRFTQLRGSADDRYGNEPTVYYDYFGEFDYFHRFNRFSLNAGHRVDYYSFNDVSSADPATARNLNIPPNIAALEKAYYLHNADRNHTSNMTHLRLGYLFRTGYEAFIRGTYMFRDYDQRNDDFGYARSSKGYMVDAGMTFELTTMLKGDVFAGYQSLDYDDSRLNNTAGMGGGMSLTWTPTGLTTVTGSFISRINETQLAGVSGYYSRIFTLAVDHELRRNIILSARAGYGNNDYNGAQVNIDGLRSYGSQRNEDIFFAGAGVKYMINRNFYARAYYDYFDRGVNNTVDSYNWNRFGVAIGASY